MSAARALRLVTVAAIDGLVPSWLERHLCLIPTARTRDSVHLACFARTTTAIAPIATRPCTSIPFACSTALGTATRRIHQSSASIKFLLANGENEFLIAIATIQDLICQCHFFLNSWAWSPLNYRLSRDLHENSILSNNARYKAYRV